MAIADETTPFHELVQGRIRARKQQIIDTFQVPIDHEVARSESGDTQSPRVLVGATQNALEDGSLLETAALIGRLASFILDRGIEVATMGKNASSIAPEDMLLIATGRDITSEEEVSLALMPASGVSIGIQPVDLDDWGFEYFAPSSDDGDLRDLCRRMADHFIASFGESITRAAMLSGDTRNDRVLIEEGVSMQREEDDVLAPHTLGNDPIARFLLLVRNGTLLGHEKVELASSISVEGLAAILKKEGYIEDYVTTTDTDRGGKRLTVTLKYNPDGSRRISGLRRVSKPGLRVYAAVDNVPRVLGGLGVAVVSTSQGLMSDREARKQGEGGEVLCFVW